MSSFYPLFCFTVERIERDIDGKVFSIFEITTVQGILDSLETVLPGHGSRSKVPKSHSSVYFACIFAE